MKLYQKVFLIDFQAQYLIFPVKNLFEIAGPVKHEAYLQCGCG